MNLFYVTMYKSLKLEVKRGMSIQLYARVSKQTGGGFVSVYDRVFHAIFFKQMEVYNYNILIYLFLFSYQIIGHFLK